MLFGQRAVIIKIENVYGDSLGNGLPMKMSDLDILRSARMHLEMHGEQAVAKAREMARSFAERDDKHGADTWLRIIVAIETMRQERGDALQ